MSGEHDVELLKLRSELVPGAKGVWVRLEDYDRTRAERDRALEQVERLESAIAVHRRLWAGIDPRGLDLFSGIYDRDQDLYAVAESIRSEQDKGQKDG